MTSKLDTAGLVERAENIIAHRIDLGSTPRAIAEQVVEALTPAAAPDMELQRFAPKTTAAGRDALPIFMGMEPDPDGAWVHYTEARAALAHKGEGR